MFGKDDETYKSKNMGQTEDVLKFRSISLCDQGRNEDDDERGVRSDNGLTRNVE